MPLPISASRHRSGDVPGAAAGDSVTVGWVVIVKLASAAGPTVGDELTGGRQHESGELGGAQFVTQHIVRHLQGVGHDGQCLRATRRVAAGRNPEVIVLPWQCG